MNVFVYTFHLDTLFLNQFLIRLLTFDYHYSPFLSHSLHHEDYHHHFLQYEDYHHHFQSQTNCPP